MKQSFQLNRFQINRTSSMNYYFTKTCVFDENQNNIPRISADLTFAKYNEVIRLQLSSLFNAFISKQ